MMDTYHAQNALKAASGQDLRGRKNTKPVLHLTLSWAPSETPTPEQMKAAALSSLKAIGLEEHEALIVAHNDTAHPHVHIVANTVHPTTGMTAPLKFTKLELSKWAESYERANEIFCDERVKNNAERDRQKKKRKRNASELLVGPQPDPNALLMAASQIAPAPEAPYVPVKHQSKSRQQWFDRKEIVSRMKAMRQAIDAEMKGVKDATWHKQTQERDALDARTEIILDAAMQKVKDHYKPYWRDLYRAQRREKKHQRQVMAYEAKQNQGRPVSAREAMEAATRPLDPISDLAKQHEEARRALSRQQRADAKLYTDAIMAQHKEQFNAMRDRQATERETEREALYAKTRGVTFMAAKASLADERSRADERKFKQAKKDEQENAPTLEQRLNRPSEKAEAKQEFGQAAKAEAAKPLPRSEQIKRDMAEWRKQNEGKDFGRDMEP
jgi:hypothetical protein